MLNPLPCPNLRGRQYYKLEPYVVVAGVYAAAAHLGSGGWTWYIGSNSRLSVGGGCWAPPWSTTRIGMPSEIPPPRSLLIKEDY